MTKQPLKDWVHQGSEIPSQGLERQRSIGTDERASLAKELGMVGLDAADVDYRISHVAGGGYRLHGSVSARGIQSCVVTLEPVPSRIDDTFDVEFWPDAMASGGGGEEQSILDAQDVEPLENGAIPVGRIVFETLSAGLEPYPRKAGAEFKWSDKSSEGRENVSPFAALGKLKPKP